MKLRNGFTLIELLVVISIISILTIITVSQFQTARKKANDVARKGDLNALSKALELYYADYGKFPDVNNGQIVVNGAIKSWGTSFDDTSANPAYIYMKVLPKENVYSTDHPYCYTVDPTLKKFALFAELENKTDKECSGTYTCNGRTYCYGVNSPNTSLGINGQLN